MKNLRVLFYTGGLFVFTLVTSCSTSKQAFYFQNGKPATKVSQKTEATSEPIYTASTGLDISKLPLPATSGEEAPIAKSIKPISKKELRQLIKSHIKAMKDTTKNKQVTVSADREKARKLSNEVKQLKNSVRVETDRDKMVVNYRKPTTDLSPTAKILIAVAAVLILIGLFSIPVIGGVLAFLLALAVVAVALALVLGIIEIKTN